MEVLCSWQKIITITQTKTIITTTEITIITEIITTTTIIITITTETTIMKIADRCMKKLNKSGEPPLIKSGGCYFL